MLVHSQTNEKTPYFGADNIISVSGPAIQVGLNGAMS